MTDAAVTDIVIVGAGQAGARAAKTMRDVGFTGRLRLLGDESHMPYERPQLSKAFLKDPASPLPEVFSPETYASLGIELCTSCAVEAIDRAARQVRLTSGETIGYDRLLLATGGTARGLSVPGFPASHMLALRTLEDSRDIERRIEGSPAAAIVGGGFIGLEVAATLRQRGCPVVVVELASRLLPRIDCDEVSELVLAHHLEAGIEIHLGARITGGGPGYLELDDGTRVKADFVVAGVGLVPNTALAAAAGLEVDDGVVVDADGRTSDPAIFAAGDVARQHHPFLSRPVRLESWHSANLQAEAAARAMVGAPPPKAEPPWVWSDQGSLNLQMAGLPETVDRTVIRRAEAEEGVTVFQFHGRRLVGGMTVNRGKDMLLIRRFLDAGLETDSFEDFADPAVPLRRLAPAR